MAPAYYTARKIRPVDFVLIAVVFGFYLYIRYVKGASGGPEVVITEAEADFVKVKHVYSTEENELKATPTAWSEFAKLPLKEALNVEHLMPKQSFRTCVEHSRGFFQPVNEDEAMCERSIGDEFLGEWAKSAIRPSPAMCVGEQGQVACFDSPAGQRVCAFDNAVINSGKMTQQEDQKMRIISRNFESGFLSTSCADPALSPAAAAAVTAPTEGVSTSRIGLGSVPLQTADLSTVSCDYVFQEPVLLYSHSNGYKFPTFLEDSMNIMSILMALDISRNVRDITLFNMDGLAQGGKINNDIPSIYFNLYKFRRVVHIGDFEKKNICFKKLITPTFPLVPFINRQPKNCSSSFTSAVMQRWNIQTRHYRSSLNDYTQKKYKNFKGREVIQVVLLTQSKFSNRIAHSVWANVQEIASEISQHFDAKGDEVDYGVAVKTLDADSVDFKTQLSLIANSSIIVGLEGPSMLIGSLLPVGTPNCCGMLELFVDSKPSKSFADVISKFGIYVERASASQKGSLVANKDKSELVVKVNPKTVINGLETLLHKIFRKQTCVLPNVAKDPFSMRQYLLDH